MDPCSCSLVQMGCGATLTLDLSWFTDLQANCLSRVGKCHQLLSLCLAEVHCTPKLAEN